MYKVGDMVVYRKDVCIIKEVKENFFNNEDYYILNPIKDESLKMSVPASNKLGLIRNLITKDDIEKLIDEIPKIDIIENNERLMEYEYKNLLASGTHEDLIKIIKTTYLRNKERTDSNKKAGSKDTQYFNIAEEYLYNEIAAVLNISYDEAKEYIINSVKEK